MDGGCGNLRAGVCGNARSSSAARGADEGQPAAVSAPLQLRWQPLVVELQAAEDAGGICAAHRTRARRDDQRAAESRGVVLRRAAGGGSAARDGLCGPAGASARAAFPARGGDGKSDAAARARVALRRVGCALFVARRVRVRESVGREGARRTSAGNLLVDGQGRAARPAEMAFARGGGESTQRRLRGGVRSRRRGALS